MGKNGTICDACDSCQRPVFDDSDRSFTYESLSCQISQTGDFHADDDDKNNDNRHTNRLLLAHAHEVIMYTYTVLVTSQDCNTQKETIENIRAIHDIEYLEHCQ